MKCAIYARVSTEDQNTANQIRELKIEAERGSIMDGHYRFCTRCGKKREATNDKE